MKTMRIFDHFGLIVLALLVLPITVLAENTTRVSVDSSGVQAIGGVSDLPSISADGRFVAFGSTVGNLVPNNTFDKARIFVHDRQTGVTTQVSIDSNGNQAGTHSFNPSISADGRFVAFTSAADDLVTSDTNNKIDVFVHDRQTGDTTRVSVSSAGIEQNGASRIEAPSLSADGRFVAFNSAATNLITGDTNGLDDIFVHDRLSGNTTRVSVDSNGAQAEGSFGTISHLPSISADGRFVAFVSNADNLVNDDTNGFAGIFVHDRQTGETTRVSVNSSGVPGNIPSTDPSISSDGRFVVFRSAAFNLVENDTDFNIDIFVHDLQTGETTRVNVDSSGAQGVGNFPDTGSPSISADGRFVTFYSETTNLVSGDTNGERDIFVHDRNTGETFRVSVDSAGGQVDGASSAPSISDDGTFVAFSSSATNLVSGDTNSIQDIFVHGPISFSGSISPAKNDLLVDFGSIGLWARMNDTSWLKLNNVSPAQVVASDMDGNGEDDVIAVFSTGIFVKRNLGPWAQLHNFTPELMAVGDLDNNGKDDVVVDFGGIGLWARMNDSSWLKLNNASPAQMVVGDMDGNGADDVIAVFSSGIFVKRNLGGWRQLHNFIPEAMTVGDLDGNGMDDVVIDFGSIALWARMNDSSWRKLNNSSPGLITTGDLDGNGSDDVIATFSGSGLRQKLNLGGWSQLNPNAPDEVITADVDGNGKDDIIAKFGSTIGGIFVKRNQAVWRKLHNSNPDSLAAGNLDVN